MAVARPHLANPAWTLLEAAKIGHTSGVGADWPVQYLSGKNQLERNLERLVITLLSDAERSIAVGLAKELMDATPGGL